MPVHDLVHERHLEQRLVAARDADVTVLAWCLMASIGRVSSSMPWVSAPPSGRVTTAGCPPALIDLIGVERHDAEA